MNQTGRLAAVLGVAASCLVITAPSAFAADVTVRPVDLAARTSWSVSLNNTDIAGIGALADPVHFDGSAHLQVTSPALRAQFGLPLRDSLAAIANKPLSYQVFVDPTGSDPAVVPFGVSLQLQVSGPIFTTLSFQPQLDGGAAAGTWRTFASTRHAAVWRTSRAIGPFAAGSDHSLTDYLGAQPQSQVNAAFLNIGTGATALNAYADDVAVDGRTYNFATAGAAHGFLTAPATVERGDATPLHLGFASPGDGPKITDASAQITLSGPASLRGRSLTLEENGAPLAFHRENQGAYTAQFPLSGETLEPGSSLTADLSLLLGRHAPCGTYIVTGRLTSDKAPTGLSVSRTFTLACPVTTPTPPANPGPPHHPGGPGLPETGAFHTAALLFSSAAAIVAGLALKIMLRRRRSH